MPLPPATELARLRKEAAARFYAIGMAELPKGCGYAFRKALSGRAWCSVDHPRISAPKPVSRRALYIWLHECAHIVLHRGKNREGKPSHVMEHEAEVWAHAKMREHGVPVPRVSTRAAKAYVGRKIRQAKRAGAKTIDPAAAAFAKR